MHGRMGALHVGEQLREDPAGRRTDAADPRVAAHLVAARRHLGGDVVQLVEHPAGPLDDDRALVGQAAALAIHQGDAQLTLEAGDVAADVGLHRVERTRCCGERPVVGDGHERRQLPQSISENDSEHLRKQLERSLVHVHNFTYRSKRIHPPSDALDRTHRWSPQTTGFRLRGPASPKRGLSLSVGGFAPTAPSGLRPDLVPDRRPRRSAAPMDLHIFDAQALNSSTSGA